MKMRPLLPEDLPTVMDIGNRSWTAIRAMAKDALGPIIYPHLNPDPETAKGRQIQQHVALHPDGAMVCEEAGRIVGFVTFEMHPARQVGEILNNAVDPDCGLKGVGQTMYQAVFEHFRAHHIKVVKVATGLDPAHAPARRAYERAGFTHKLEQVTYYRTL